jgi:hypothetical protein
VTLDPATRRAFAAHRRWRDAERARIVRLLQRAGYPVRTWAQAERVARRLTRRH